VLGYVDGVDERVGLGTDHENVFLRVVAPKIT
jgi:hypothetical protein